jgi:uncharacterized protein (DUF952 family)
MENIYHICKRTDWDEVREDESYRADSLQSEGFIHCSKYSQVLRVADVFYRGQKNLVILVIAPERLKAELRWEPGSDKPDELFPHIHGPLNRQAVTRVLEFSENQDGQFYLPSLEK